MEEISMVLASITDQKQKDKFTLSFARLISLSRIKPAIADWLWLMLLNNITLLRYYLYNIVNKFFKIKFFEFKIYIDRYCF
jgi:hypothetical protein